MTTPNNILADLLISQSTCDALAERLRVPMLAVRAMCVRHETDGLLARSKLADSIIVWRLTDNGREVARSMIPASAVL